MDRQPIWGVKDDHLLIFSGGFVLLFFIGIIFLFCYEVFHVTEDDGYETASRFIKAVGTIGISSAIFMFSTLQGIDVMGILRDKYRRHQFEQGLEQGRKEQFDKTMEWYKRKDNNPPPTPVSDKNQENQQKS